MMKTIVVINDGTSAADNATKLAYMIATKTEANILVAQTCPINSFIYSKVIAGLGTPQPAFITGNHSPKLLNELAAVTGYRPELTILNLPDADATQLAEVIAKNDAWLVINGMALTSNRPPALDIQFLLNKLRCPLLLVPESWSPCNIKRITYIADLRYCRLSIVRYLAELAKFTKASVSVAHLSAKGLPPIEENYSRQLFATEVASMVKDCKLVFNNIREVNIGRAVDVIIHGMQNDMLVLINHRFHFKEIIGERLGHSLPSAITIPVLLFPY